MASNLVNRRELIGVLSARPSLSGSITGRVGLQATIGIPEIVVHGDGFYTGKYEVYPDVEAITLPTRNKTCEKDITVFKIPLWETSNPYGTTVYIGGEEIYGQE